MGNLKDKIKHLKEEFKDSQDPLDKVQEWEEVYRNLMLAEDLYKHQAIKFLVSKFQEEVSKINKQLLSSESMNENSRDRLIMERDEKKKVYSYFFDNARRIEEITSLINEEYHN
jgi:hypothetical protein